jgi:hypothetical protein
MSGRRGERDVAFLARIFQKLLLNFTWWVNRKDEQGNNLFSGGFLGLDNIGIFDRSVYEDMASKFFEHFVAIVDAMNSFGGTGLWDEQDGFYYDKLELGDRNLPLRTRSMVGIIPLFAVEVLER